MTPSHKKQLLSCLLSSRVTLSGYSKWWSPNTRKLPRLLPPILSLFHFSEACYGLRGNVRATWMAPVSIIPQVSPPIPLVTTQGVSARSCPFLLLVDCASQHTSSYDECAQDSAGSKSVLRPSRTCGAQQPQVRLITATKVHFYFNLRPLALSMTGQRDRLCSNQHNMPNKKRHPRLYNPSDLPPPVFRLRRQRPHLEICSYSTRSSTRPASA